MTYEEVKTPQQLLQFMDCIDYGYTSQDGVKYTYKDKDKLEKEFYSKYNVSTYKDVLRNKLGVCWDQTELEKNWFLNNEYNCKTYFMWFELSRPNKAATHSFLVYEKDNKYYWFEHSWDLYKGIHEYKSLESLLKYIARKHALSEIIKKTINQEEVNTLRIYNYDKVPYGKNASSYLKSVTSGKRVY